MILVICGPSGSGKTTLLGHLSEIIPGLQPLESITTRPPRATDQPGEYAHVSENKFREIGNNCELLWHVKIGAYRYGTRKKAVDDALSAGFNVAIITIDAAQKLHRYVMRHRKLGLTRSLYLYIDDETELRRRMKARGGLSPSEIEERLIEGREWNKEAKKDDHFRKIDALRSTPEEITETAINLWRM
ncbi:MAG TPA: hypothetical protein VG934_03380 [Candidatus Paceibacterota bacterium]|nr:hypothetical protein [Candidatus Paceibacterota bacterium]